MVQADAARLRVGAVVTGDEILSTWLVKTDLDLRLYVGAAREKALGEPELRLLLGASRGDSITVQVVDGLVPLEPNATFYVLDRGTYRLAKRDALAGRARVAAARHVAGRCLPLREGKS